jgi:hypothetical protein
VLADGRVAEQHDRQDDAAGREGERQAPRDEPREDATERWRRGQADVPDHAVVTHEHGVVAAGRRDERDPSGVVEGARDPQDEEGRREGDGGGRGGDARAATAAHYRTRRNVTAHAADGAPGKAPKP